MSSGSSSGAKPTNGSAKHREHQQGRQDREYTKEQKIAVQRIKACKVDAYYEILAVEKEASDGQIKKAYHKLSLQIHPDKNGAPGADEAFKMISKAFQVLSDPQKRAIFDQTGGDPEARFSPGAGGSRGAQGSPFAGFTGTPRGGGGMFEAEISPEDLLNMFFGGGGMGRGGMFDGGQGGFATFGGPGIRVHQFGGPRMRRRAPPADARGPNGERQGAEQQEPTSVIRILVQLLPLILFFLLPAITSLFSGDGTEAARGPAFSVDKVPPYTLMRETPEYKIPYWVNPNDINELGKRDINNLDKRAEQRIISDLSYHCRLEHQAQQQALEESEGWFYIDQEKRKRARNMPKPSCQRMKDLGIEQRRGRDYY